MKPKFDVGPLILKATKDSGQTGTKKVLDGSLFLESADKGLIGLIKTSLANKEQRELLFDMLGARTKEPIPQSEIIKVFDKFSDLGKIELTPEDIKLINFTIKYFENWFYAGKWAQVSHKQNQNPKAYAYFSVPAGILNVLTKVKDSQTSPKGIVGFDLERLEELQKEVRDFATRYLSADRLESILSGDLGEEKRAQVQFLYDNREAMLRTFSESERSVQDEFRGGRGSSGSKAPELYLLKTCLIAAEMSRRQQEIDANHYVFVPDEKISTHADRYQMFDFSLGRDNHSSMHFPKDRIAYGRFLVEYLRSKKTK